MTELLLHIGLSKCASGTLQRKVFRFETGYLGTGPGMANEANLAKRLQEHAPFGGKQTLNLKGLARWVDQVKVFQRENCPAAKRLLLSNEVLSTSSRTADRPIVEVLRVLKNQLWTGGSVRVLLVLRNQAARLASAYAQTSNQRLGAGQQDFESHVVSHLHNARNLRHMDYAAWVEEIGAVVGEDNLCVLLLEESNTLEFWHQLKDFCVLEHFDPEGMFADVQRRSNKRSLSGARWRLNKFDPDEFARVRAKKIFNFVWPVWAPLPGRTKVSNLVAAAFKAQATRRVEQFAEEIEGEIALSNRVEELVQTHCASFNRRLGELLSKDVRALGY